MQHTTTLYGSEYYYLLLISYQVTLRNFDKLGAHYPTQSRRRAPPPPLPLMTPDPQQRITKTSVTEYHNVIGVQTTMYIYMHYYIISQSMIIRYSYSNQLGCTLYEYKLHNNINSIITTRHMTRQRRRAYFKLLIINFIYLLPYLLFINIVINFIMISNDSNIARMYLVCSSCSQY